MCTGSLQRTWVGEIGHCSFLFLHLMTESMLRHFEGCIIRRIFACTCMPHNESKSVSDTKLYFNMYLAGRTRWWDLVMGVDLHSGGKESFVSCTLKKSDQSVM